MGKTLGRCLRGEKSEDFEDSGAKLVKINRVKNGSSKKETPRELARECSKGDDKSTSDEDQQVSGRLKSSKSNSQRSSSEDSVTLREEFFVNLRKKPMTFHYRKRLRSMQSTLQQELVVDAAFFNSLLEQEVFEKPTVDKLRSLKNDKKELLCFFIKVLSKRSQFAFFQFLYILRMSKQFELMEKIDRGAYRLLMQYIPRENPNLDHNPFLAQSNSTFEKSGAGDAAAALLQSIDHLRISRSNKPTFHFELSKRIDVTKIKCVDSNSHHPANFYNYKMTSWPRGEVLIINIETFVKDPTGSPMFDKRDGTEVDGYDLKTLMQYIGFIPFQGKQHTNLTSVQMRKLINEYAMYEKHKDYDASWIIILTHGNENEKLYGTDGRYIHFENDVRRPFESPEAVRNLVGKPKIFQIVACRGSKEDYGNERKPHRSSQNNVLCQSDWLEHGGNNSNNNANDSNLVSKYERHFSTPVNTLKERQRNVEEKAPISIVPNNSALEVADTVPCKPQLAMLDQAVSKSHNRISENADILILYSVGPGHISIRSKKFGTWYVRAFIHTIFHYAHEKDLLSMMNIVHEHVSTQVTGENFLNMPQLASYLRKAVYLNPGYPKRMSAVHNIREQLTRRNGVTSADEKKLSNGRSSTYT